MNSKHFKTRASIFKIKGLLVTGLLAFSSMSHAEQVTHSYDDLNRLIRSDYGNGNVIDYSYDTAGNRTSHQVTVPNKPPVANAGADQSVKVGASVILNGSSSTDPDNAPSPLTYSWTQISGPSVALTGATTISPSFTPTASGTYLFNLTVSDSLASATDEVKIDVVDNNPAVTLGTLKVNQLLINKKHKTFFLLSNFTLGNIHNGINPLNEAVSLKIGNFSTTIPTGSFRKLSKYLFAYVGTINKVKVEATIKSLGNNRYSFQAAGAGHNFNGLTNPVTVDLGIGDDNATTSVNAVIK